MPHVLFIEIYSKGFPAADSQAKRTHHRTLLMRTMVRMSLSYIGIHLSFLHCYFLFLISLHGKVQRREGTLTHLYEQMVHGILVTFIYSDSSTSCITKLKWYVLLHSYIDIIIQSQNILFT